MSEMGKRKGQSEMDMLRIRTMEHKAKEIQGDLAALYLTENDTLAALDGLKKERDLVKDAIVRTLRNYQFAGHQLESRWRWEEQQRKRKLKSARTYLRETKRGFRAMKRRSPEQMRDVLRKHERTSEIEAGLAQEVIDILTGGDPQDLKHSLCYERFLQFIRCMPIYREPMRPFILDGRGILTSIVSHCRHFGWHEERTAAYITNHWVDLETVCLRKP
jgi:hypothetical protein